jgi:hypothetical protein
VRQAFEGLAQNINTQHAKREITCQIDDYYVKKLKLKSIEAFQHYTARRLRDRETVENFTMHKDYNTMRRCFIELIRNQNYQRFKRSYLPFFE